MMREGTTSSGELCGQGEELGGPEAQGDRQSQRPGPGHNLTCDLDPPGRWSRLLEAPGLADRATIQSYPPRGPRMDEPCHLDGAGALSLVSCMTWAPESSLGASV